MLSNTVRYSSTPTIFDSKKVDDDHPKNNSESSPLTSEISFVRNSENIIFIKKKTSIPITDGFFTRVWRCFQTSEEKHSNENICDEEGIELAKIFTQGEDLRQQANSLYSPGSEVPVPRGWRGSLLKRCLVGAGLLTGTGVLGGAGYAGYRHYNCGTSGTEKSRDMLQESGGSLDNSFGNHALYHDSVADRSRYRRHNLRASAYNAMQSGLTGNRWENFFNNRLKKINDRIIKLLYQEGLLLNKKSRYKEKILCALSRYLHYGDSLHNENKIKILAQKILYGSGIYGEKNKEQLSNEQAKSVVRYWVFKNIFSTTPEKYIESKIKLDTTRVYTINDIHNLLSVDKLAVINHFQLNSLTQIEQSSFHMMWKDFLLDDMPFLVFGDKKTKSILLNDSDFANLYSGSRFIKNLKGEEFFFDEFSPEQMMTVGESMWTLATTEGIPENKLSYYLAPALLFNAVSDDLQNKLEYDIDIINSYLNYRESINSVTSDINKKSHAYLTAAKSWLTKMELVNKIIDKCNLDILSDASIRRVAQQNYLDGILNPCDNAPDDLDKEYTKQTVYVADKFREIDKYLMIPAFDLLPADEQEFISSPNTVIHMAKLLVNSSYIARLIRNGNPNKEIIAPLNNTVIFTVQQDNQERIYALKAVKKHLEYYKLIRVDRVLDNYLKNDILDDDFINKKEPPRIFFGKLRYLYYAFFSIDRYHFNEVFKIDNDSIIAKQNDMHLLIDALSNSHHMTLFNDLYKLGNEQSDLQKKWNVVKHLIPFYDCIDSINEENIAAAAIECSLDTIALIPFFGQATKLSVKFSTGLTSGLHKGMVRVGGQGTKVMLRNILREVSLPTTADIASLGKSAIMTLDPGFSILMSVSRISRTFAKKIVKLISEKKKTATLVTSLETRIAKLPLITPSQPLTGVLAGTKLEIPVLAVGKKGGENIYVKMDPQTGEVSGTKYICRREAVFLPLSSTLRRHKRSEDDNHNHYRRVRRMNNNALLCYDSLAISPGSQNAINNYERVIDIVNIPQQNTFLRRSPTHPYKEKYSGKGFVDLQHDKLREAEEVKRCIREYYRSNEFFSFRLNQEPAIIPPEYVRIRDRLPIYQHAVNRAKELVETLDNRFRDMEILQLRMARIAGLNINSMKVELYLSYLLQLDTIDDIKIVNIIKKEAIERLKEYVRYMKFFFNNEINNIYFVAANNRLHIPNENTRVKHVRGFVSPRDIFRRVIIMADFFKEHELGRLSLIILHEVSHLVGSSDCHVSSGANAVDSMLKFNNAALGIGPGHITLDDNFMEHYQHLTRRQISREQLAELIKRDPVLRANLFMDNAYFLPTMIEELCDILQ